jgi:hypothetical protein
MVFPQWDDFTSPQSELDKDEQACLTQIQNAEQRLRDWKQSFALYSSNFSSQDITGCIYELNRFASMLEGWRSTTEQLSNKGRTMCSGRLMGLIGEVSATQRLWNDVRGSRASFEAFQRGQQGGRGSPAWSAATSGFSCAWCGRTLVGLPSTPDFCPSCGRVPRP